MIILILGLLAAASAGTSSDNKDNYKNQFRSSGHAGKHKEKHENFSTEYCTDPRTMKKHAAYTEWADAYSCTRHRCQPGGRNLAIYTVGCKRVEAPESAIECEEVVEDTNMQFPFCCTRLRCLVVVRGEVWTRVLGQPWEVLPAAPWSHMYKMKKPPPSDSTFLSKTTDQGPVYELAERESDTEGHEKVLRASPKKDNSDYNEEGSQSARPPLPPPDIVIALSTNEEKESSQNKNDGTSRRSKHRKANVQLPANYFQAETETEKHGEPKNQEVTDVPPETTASTEKPPETAEDETTNNNYAATETATHRSQHSFNTVSWTEIPQNQWVEPKEGAEMESHVEEHSNNFRVQDTVPHLEMSEPKKNLQIPLKEGTADKPSNLQALVDAIGSRMRDIESVVQKMSDKVHRVQTPAEGSSEKRMSAEREKSHRDSKRPSAEDRDSKRPSAEDDSYKRVSAEREKSHRDSKRPSAEDDSYKRFPTNKERGSKYLHLSVDSNTEKPLFIEDSYNLTGYFSDASNSVLRRNNPPKQEPPPTYMAPVDTRRKGPAQIAVQNTADDVDKKHKKRTHKKRKGKGSRSHRKHSHSKDGRKRFNKLSSGEAEKNAVSLEDSSGVVQ